VRDAALRNGRPGLQLVNNHNCGQNTEASSSVCSFGFGFNWTTRVRWLPGRMYCAREGCARTVPPPRRTETRPLGPQGCGRPT
jgi:hypothetical protein